MINYLIVLFEGYLPEYCYLKSRNLCLNLGSSIYKTGKQTFKNLIWFKIETFLID